MVKKRKRYSGPRLPKNPESAKQYRVYYYKLADTDEYAVKQDTSGATNEKARAFGLAAMHVATAEVNKGEYAKAIVIDAWAGRFIRVYTLKPGEMIRIKEY
jgi:hypothetical protein